MTLEILAALQAPPSNRSGGAQSTSILAAWDGRTPHCSCGPLIGAKVDKSEAAIG